MPVNWCGCSLEVFNFLPAQPIFQLPEQSDRRIRMALMTWSKKFSVGVQALDDQHTVLVQLLNDLHAAMMKGQTQTFTGPLLHKLAEYTRTHFTAEEKILSAARFPALAEHRKIHINLLKQVDEFAARYDKGQVTLNLDLLTFLRDWLNTHILKEDHEYGSWLNEHGVR
jgi:hemerythrin